MEKSTEIFCEWKKASQWIKEGRKIAFGMVVKTWGSSPRPLGSVLVIRDDEVFEGSVSGGCVEGTVIVEAMELLKTGQSKLLQFKANTHDVWAPGLSCGGKILILIFPVKFENFETIHQIQRNLENKIRTAIIANLKNGNLALICADKPDSIIPKSVTKKALECLEEGTPKVITEGQEEYFVNIISPPPRLYIIGAVHVAQSLVPIAQRVGFEVVLVDPREAFANSDRFSNNKIFVEWPESFLKKENLNSESAIITLTHDPKLDEPALEVALKSDCFYIGALGSKKTHQARLENLKTKGFPADHLKRISGPAGIPIRSQTPQEISISILAELIQAYRSPRFRA